MTKLQHIKDDERERRFRAYNYILKVLGGIVLGSITMMAILGVIGVSRSNLELGSVLGIVAWTFSMSITFVMVLVLYISERQDILSEEVRGIKNGIWRQKTKKGI